MPIRWSSIVLIALLLFPNLAAAQQQAQTPAPEQQRQQDQQQDQQEQQEIPWPVHLGLRVLLVEETFPLIDRVVLVPDAATYLDELAKWSPRGRWPVLIEDTHLAPMFIRRFQPAQVIRRESVGEQPVTQEAIANITITAFGGNPQVLALRDVFDAHTFTPPGVVVASLDDPAWTAAAALAAGRGQPLVWIDNAFGRPDDVIDQSQADQLAALIEQGLASHGWSYATLGDEIDTITICRAIAGRVNLPRPDNGEIEPAAITDYLGRHNENGHERYALVGWIFGDEIRSAYIAMCSLFLPRSNVTMLNTYGWREGEGWDYFEMNGPTALLAEHGFEPTHYSDRRANETAWLGMIASGMRTDVLVMNSRGNPFEIEVYQGRVWPQDVPILTTPVALHLTHSWSMRSPGDFDTVGGRWLSRGVYAYVGSTHEPYLSAFHTPTMLAKRWVSHVPFLVSARYWALHARPFSWPWKVNTIGDPLMVAASPLHHRKERIEQAADYGTDLNERVEQLLRATREDPSPANYAEAIALLDLLGRDDIALPLWEIAHALGEQHARASAGAALGPLFRARNAEGYMQAWLLLDRRDELAVDMLWHLHTPRLNLLSDDDLLQLQSAIRRPASHVDISRLAPHLARRFGPDHVRSLIQRELDQTRPGRYRTRLEAVLNEYE